MMTSLLSSVALLAFCGGTPQATASSDDTPASGSTAAEAYCPEETVAVGAPPPDGFEVGCEKTLASGERVLHGPWQQWHENGEFAALGLYETGDRTGDWSWWHEDGQPAEQGAYQAGERTGTWQQWDEQGTLVSEGDYVDGQRQGAWTRWHENGEVSEVAMYEDGRLDGLWVAYHPDGTRRAMGEYENGIRQGEWTFWNEEGRVAEQGMYEEGDRVGAWTTRFPEPATAEAADAEPPAEVPPTESANKAEPPPPAAAPDFAEVGLYNDSGLPLVLPNDLRSDAIEPAQVDLETIRRLKPTNDRLPPHPEATTDFTAYTLEGGAVKVGLGTVAVGVVNHVQLGTVPWLYLVGIDNVSLKVDAVRHGPFHLAVKGSRFWLNQEEFAASITAVGATSTLKLTPGWSIHGGVEYMGLATAGTPSTCGLPSWLGGEGCSTAGGSTMETGNALGLEGNDLYADVMRLQAATDFRFNRRDSLIVQWEAVNWARVRLDDSIEVPDETLPVVNINPKEVVNADGRQPLDAFYTASIAWQMAWKNTHLRFGFGIPVTNPIWVTKTMELSFRFGGRSRVERTMQKRTWRRNKRAVKRSLRNQDDGTLAHTGAGNGNDA